MLQNQLPDEEINKAGLGLQNFSLEDEMELFDAIPQEVREWLNTKAVLKWSVVALCENFANCQKYRFRPGTPPMVIWRWLISQYKAKEQEAMEQIAMVK